MSENKVPSDIVRVIAEKRHLLLLTHEHPDGDAIGSLLGLADMCDRMGKNVFAYLDEPVSHLYNFLPRSDRVNCSIDDLTAFVEQADGDVAAIALDCGEADRLGFQKNRLLDIHPFVVIDHHRSHLNYGDYRWVDSCRSSTGEMVYELAEALDQVPSQDCAFDLYVAIATDTGSFRYESTGARTLEVAARLIRCGARPEQVAKHIYDNYSRERLKLMELVLGTLELCENDSIAFIHVTRAMFSSSGTVMDDVEGFVDYPRSIRCVKVAVFMKEVSPDLVSVSLRAKGDCDVSEVAKLFDGGGHRNAAGCRFRGMTLSEVRQQLEPVLIRHLTEQGCGKSANC